MVISHSLSYFRHIFEANQTNATGKLCDCWSLLRVGWINCPWAEGFLGSGLDSSRRSWKEYIHSMSSNLCQLPRIKI